MVYRNMIEFDAEDYNWEKVAEVSHVHPDARLIRSRVPEYRILTPTFLVCSLIFWSFLPVRSYAFCSRSASMVLEKEKRQKDGSYNSSKSIP